MLTGIGAMIVLLLAGAALAGDGEALMFEYFPSGGSPVYHSADTSDPMVLIEVERLSDPDLEAQDAALDTIDAEAYRLRVVVACTTSVAPHRYATSTITARELRGKIIGLRATLLGPNGNVLERSHRPLPVATILAALKKHAD